MDIEIVDQGSHEKSGDDRSNPDYRSDFSKGKASEQAESTSGDHANKIADDTAVFKADLRLFFRNDQ